MGEIYRFSAQSPSLLGTTHLFFLGWELPLPHSAWKGRAATHTQTSRADI